MCMNLHTGQAWLALYRGYTHLSRFTAGLRRADFFQKELRHNTTLNWATNSRDYRRPSLALISFASAFDVSRNRRVNTSASER